MKLKLPTTSGIYTITNIINGKIYIGFAKNFQGRYRNHFYKLRNGVHKNKHLQSAFDKNGEENFRFEVLEEYPNEKFILASMEHYWANLLNVHDRKYGYNKRPTHPYGKSVNNKEIRDKISNSNKGRKQSKESREKAKKTYKDTIERRKNDPEWIFREIKHSKNKGKKRTEEQKQNIRAKMIGRKVSPESIEKFKKTRTGMKLNLSKEERQKISKKGEDLVKRGIFKAKTQPVLLFNLNMILIKEYFSIKELCKKMNFSSTIIQKRLNDGKPWKGYYVKYKGEKYIFNRKKPVNPNNYTRPVIVFDDKMNLIFEGKSLKEVTNKGFMSKISVSRALKEGKKLTVII